MSDGEESRADRLRAYAAIFAAPRRGETVEATSISYAAAEALRFQADAIDALKDLA